MQDDFFEHQIFEYFYVIQNLNCTWKTLCWGGMPGLGGFWVTPARDSLVCHLAWSCLLACLPACLYACQGQRCCLPPFSVCTCALSGYHYPLGKFLEEEIPFSASIFLKASVFQTDLFEDCPLFSYIFLHMFLSTTRQRTSTPTVQFPKESVGTESGFG